MIESQPEVLKKRACLQRGWQSRMDRKTIMRKAIADAMERVIDRTGSLRDVSVQAILEECGLSRPTFYRYFSDKYDVVNWSYTYHVEELTGLYNGQKDNSDEEMLRRFIGYFYDKRSYFIKVMDYLGQNSFYEHYFTAFVRWYTVLHYQEPRNIDTLSSEEAYMLVYSASGTSQVLRKWITNGCTESPEQMLRILQQLVPMDVE